MEINDCLMGAEFQFGKRKKSLQYVMLGKLDQFRQFSHSVVSDSDPMDCSMPGFPAHQQLPEFTQTDVH